jgi:hypothetical protein
MAVDELVSEFDPQKYPQYFVSIARACAAYRASSRAVSCFGHSPIMAAIQMVAGHETGAIRDYNVDAIPVEGCLEQLVIIRSVFTGEVVALTETEYRRELNWPLP